MPKQSTAPVLPAWLDPELWDEFLRHRKALKKPMTDYAQILAFKLLERFKTAGHDPQASIEQSIFNGWQGLFEPRAVEISAAPKTGTVHADTLRAKTQADDERNAAVDPVERARNAAAARKRLGLRPLAH